MSDKSKIEWTDATWNPVHGCTKVSAGCKNCYAERVSKRWGKDFDKIEIHPDRLEQPLKWKRPRRIFVNSMSDLFHGQVPESFIDKVFGVMASASQHTFQILTKRPHRMMEYMISLERAHRETSKKPWPLPNVWLGTSVEDQQSANDRIPDLLKTPAAVRFISAEPLIGPVDFGKCFPDGWYEYDPAGKTSPFLGPIDWVICGGESGPGARPMQPDWARRLREQCGISRTAFFFKQWGEWGPVPVKTPSEIDQLDENQPMFKVGKKNAGRLLDGREWNDFPGGK